MDKAINIAMADERVKQIIGGKEWSVFGAELLSAPDYEVAKLFLQIRDKSYVDDQRIIIVKVQNYVVTVSLEQEKVTSIERFEVKETTTTTRG